MARWSRVFIHAANFFYATDGHVAFWPCVYSNRYCRHVAISGFFCSVAPLLLPHEATKDFTVNGFHIRKKSRVIINAWAIGRDPSVWSDAEKFFPDRFVGSNIDVRGRDFELIPFGSGRRGCPGMQLGLTAVRLVVAQLVHCFDWELPNNMLPTELDMTEEFGLVTPRAKHLLAFPAYCLGK